MNNEPTAQTESHSAESAREADSALQIRLNLMHAKLHPKQGLWRDIFLYCCNNRAHQFLSGSGKCRGSF